MLGSASLLPFAQLWWEESGQAEGARGGEGELLEEGKDGFWLTPALGALGASWYVHVVGREQPLPDEVLQ